jgi:hypothetical protein
MRTGDTISELRERIDQLESKLDALESSDEPREQRFGRRHLLAAAGGAIAGGVLASAKPAGAATGDPLILGQENSATSETVLKGGFRVDARSTVPTGFAASIFAASRALHLTGTDQALFAYNDQAGAPAVFIGSRLSDALVVHAGEGAGFPDPGRVTGITTGSDHPQVMPIVVEGGRAHALLAPRAESGPPPTLLHDKGEVALDANTDLHVCHTAGTPGSWHRLLSDRSPLGTAAGTIVLRDSPFRLYDSRPGRQSALPGPKEVLAAGEARDLDVVGQGTPALPAEAIGVLATVTVTATGTSGHLRAYAAGTPAPNTSIINWDHTGQTIATTTMIRIGDGGAITVRASSTATHFLVDILGWIA